MGKWPHCVNGRGPMECGDDGHGICPDCGYETDEQAFRTEPYPWEDK